MRNTGVTVGVILAASALWSQQGLPAGAELQPVKGVEFVLKSFDKYPVVAIGDLPGCEELYGFLRTLVRAPEFAGKVNDIVVDFGNPLYQAAADRYVLDGELTPRAVLRHIWDDTTESPFLTWDSPVYAEFLDAVRAVNLGLPKEKRLRVILADAPISWRKIENRRQWLDLRGAAREQALASRIGEVLANHRRALAIGAAAHFYRGGTVEQAIRGRLLTILTQGRLGTADTYQRIEAREARVPEGAIAALAHTWLGGIPVDARAGSPHLESVADAVLYLGPSGWLTARWPSGYVFQNDEFWAELQRRWSLTQNQPFDLAAAGFDLRGRLADVSMPISADPLPQRKVPRESGASPAPAQFHPVDALEFVLGKLDEYPVVALGDVHLCLEFHRFAQRLVRDPRLAGKINDIIVEFGNPKYQDAIDRYVVKGEDVPRDERKRAWQEAAMGWWVANSPLYEQFFDTVREVNRGLPAEKRMRVILGDAPVDLAEFRANPEQYLQRFGGGENAGNPRDASLAASINRVLDQHRRALMICGNGHLRGTGRANARQLVEAAHPGKFFLLDSNGPAHPSWPRPSVVAWENDPEPAHATLWLGPFDELTGVRPSPLLYRDRAYISTVSVLEELTRRRSLLDLADPAFEYRGRYFDRPAPAAAVETLTNGAPKGLADFLLEPATPGGGHFSKGSDAIAADSISLRDMIGYAFEIPAAEVVGAQWLDQKYKVHASAGTGEKAEFRKMFREALAQRLHLKFDRVEQMMPVRVLRVADRAAVESHLGKAGEPERLEGTNSSVVAANVRPAVLRELLSEALRAPVIDETGVDGPFSFQIEWKAGDVRSLTEALRRSLGVEVGEDRRGVRVIVVERE